jgi:hypothetical protein
MDRSALRKLELLRQCGPYIAMVPTFRDQECTGSTLRRSDDFDLLFRVLFPSITFHSLHIAYGESDLRIMLAPFAHRNGQTGKYATSNYIRSGPFQAGCHVVAL